MFEIKVVRKIRTHFLCSITCSEAHAVYEVTWKSIVELVRPQMTIWHMHIICWYLRLQTHS